MIRHVVLCSHCLHITHFACYWWIGAPEGLPAFRARGMRAIAEPVIATTHQWNAAGLTCCARDRSNSECDYYASENPAKPHLISC